MSSMSPDFLSNAESRTEGLTALMVHPRDLARLKALSGIWPVEDTLTRMIDVFIATGGAGTSSTLRTAPQKAPETPAVVKAEARAPRITENPPAPAQAGSRPVAVQEVKPAPAKAAVSMKSPEAGVSPRYVMTSPPAAAPSPDRKPEVRPAAVAPIAKPKDVQTPVKAKSAPLAPVAVASPPMAEVLTFNRNDSLDLRFASLEGFSFGTISRQGPGVSWSSLYEDAVVEAFAKGETIETLGDIGVRLRAGRHSDRGYRLCPKIDASLQFANNTYVFIRMMRLVDRLGLEFKACMQWDDRPDACHPGRRGLFTARPILGAGRLAAARENEPETSGEPQFPTLGAMVGYVYLDRPDEEKIALLVKGPADPVAGQISIGSPLGLALIDTAKGKTGILEVNGRTRKIKVLEILES